MQPHLGEFVGEGVLGRGGIHQEVLRLHSLGPIAADLGAVPVAADDEALGLVVDDVAVGRDSRWFEQANEFCERLRFAVVRRS